MALKDIIALEAGVRAASVSAVLAGKADSVGMPAVLFRRLKTPNAISTGGIR